MKRARGAEPGQPAGREWVCEGGVHIAQGVKWLIMNDFLKARLHKLRAHFQADTKAR